MGSGGCAEVTLVTLVALQGVVIGQDVGIELQQCSGSNVLIISSSSKEYSTWLNSSFFLRLLALVLSCQCLQACLDLSFL